MVRALAGYMTAALVVLFLVAAPVAAQTVVSPVLTVDLDKLFAQSGYGKQVSARFDTAMQELRDENQRIVTALSQEEQDLTAERDTLDHDVFRAKADAFDAKVQQTRSERDTRQAEIEANRNRARSAFLDQAFPVLEEIARERSAAVVMDSRAVLLKADFVDITDEAIRRLDERLPDAPTQTPQQE